jgi:hypothetical protein
MTPTHLPYSVALADARAAAETLDLDQTAEAFLDGSIGEYETGDQDEAIMQFFRYLAGRLGRALTRGEGNRAAITMAIAWNKRDPATVAAQAEGDRRFAEREANRPRYVPSEEEAEAMALRNRDYLATVGAWARLRGAAS